VAPTSGSAKCADERWSAYDPDLIVLGGSVSKGFSFFEGGMRRRLQDFDYQHSLERTTITCSDVDHVAILGAAALFMDPR
jgi:glucokinase